MQQNKLNFFLNYHSSFLGQITFSIFDTHETPGGASTVERNLFQSKRPLWNFFVPIVNERLGDAEIFRAFLSWVSCLWEWTFWIKCWHNKLANFRHTESFKKTNLFWFTVFKLVLNQWDVLVNVWQENFMKIS